jgi:hypothetical protein
MALRGVSWESRGSKRPRGWSGIRGRCIAAGHMDNSGADDGIRTRDPHLGKVVLYR